MSETSTIEDQLAEARSEIDKLKLSVSKWKDGWFHLRDLIGQMSWEHRNCGMEKISVDEKPSDTIHYCVRITRVGNNVWQRDAAGAWIKVGSGASPEAAEAIMRLMSIK